MYVHFVDYMGVAVRIYMSKPHFVNMAVALSANLIYHVLKASNFTLVNSLCSGRQRFKNIFSYPPYIEQRSPIGMCVYVIDALGVSQGGYGVGLGCPGQGLPRSVGWSAPHSASQLTQSVCVEPSYRADGSSTPRQLTRDSRSFTSKFKSKNFKFRICKGWLS